MIQPPAVGRSGQTRVLLVEDDPGDARLVREALRSPAGVHFVVEHVSRLGDALERLRREPVDVVLLDLTLPDSAGMATLEALQAQSEVAVVVLTGLDDVATGQATIEHGAQDYLVKGEVDERTLPRALRYAVERDHALRRLRGLLSEQQAANEALSHAEERYRSVAAAALDAMLLADADGRILAWNPAAERLFGYPSESTQDLRVTDLLTEPARSHTGEALGRTSMTGRPTAPVNRTVEMTALRADGGLTPAEWSIATWRDSVGRFFSATVRDTSERHEALLLSDLVRAQHDITEAGFDRDLILRITARWSMTLTGAAGAGIVTGSEEAVGCWEAATGSLAAADPSRPSDTTVTAEIDQGDGPPALLAIDAPPADGRQERRHEMLEVIAGFCSAALARVSEFDAKHALLTERTSMLAASRAQEERFRRAFDDAPVSVALVSLHPDRAGALLRINDALAELLGLPGGTVDDGVHLADFAHPEDRAAVSDAVARLAACPAQEAFAARLRTTDGSVRHVEATAAAAGAVETAEPYAVVQLADVTATYEAQQELRRLALHDPLTGVPNRVLLTDRLEQALGRSRRSGEPAVVMFVDLDGFKHVNDIHGHHAGDELLVEVARRLVAGLRESDTVARIGGDEFAVVCDGLGSEEAAIALAERLGDLVRAPCHLVAATVSVTASVGVHLTREHDTPQEALQAADHAMYHAKHHGRDRCELSRPRVAAIAAVTPASPGSAAPSRPT